MSETELIDHACSLALGYGASGREDVRHEYMAARAAAKSALQQALADRDSHQRVAIEAMSNIARLTAALSAETEACAKAVDNVREGNMMLDNEPVLFVKGFEMACVEGAAAIRQRQGERS